MQDTLLLERKYADFHALNLDPEALDRWNACRSTHRFSTFENKQLYVFSLLKGEPEVEDILTCVDVDLSLTGGLSTYWERSSGKDFSAGHVPCEVYPGVFLWHIFFNEMSYTPYNGKYSLRLPMGYRSPHNIHKYRTDGVTYVLERAVFETMFNGA